MRALLSEAGKITDRYRYSAYGELLEKTGNTENHYLYTGECYDGISGLYYLRARYMDPSTGTFTSMDSYAGSIYEPATLHRYLYANGNPVSYSDPGGHFAGLIGSMATTAISAVMRNIHTLNVMGLISGVTNAAVTGILGGSGKDIGSAFIKGYLTGFGLGAIMYVAAAFEIMTIAQMCMLMAASNTVMSVVLTIAAVSSGNTKAALVYGTFSILSFITFCQAFKVNGSVTITGDKGTAKAEVKNAGAEDVSASKGGSGTTKVGRWMSEDEYNKMLRTEQVQMSGDNKVHVANPADIDAFGKQAPKGSVYVEFDVPSNTVFPGGKDGWGIIAGPGSLYDRLNIKKGLPPIEEMPKAVNIELKVKK